MASRLPLAFRLAPRTFGVRAMSGMGEFGSGVGKGGGGGGAVREAGGAFGKMEAAHEEMYFRKLEKEQFAKLRQHLEDEVKFHKEQIGEHEQAIQLKKLRESIDDDVQFHAKAIRDHQEAIERHKRKIQKLKHQEKEVSGEHD